MSSTPTAPQNTEVPSFKHRVLIADNSRQKFAEVIQSLEESAVEVRYIPDRAVLNTTVAEFKPEIIVMNLFMGNASTLTNLREISRMMVSQGGCKIIMITSHYSKENIAECIKNGASDFVLEPFDGKMLLQRIRYQLQEREFISPDDLRAEPTQVAAGFQLCYETLKILSEVKDVHRALYEVLKRVGELSKSTRVNLVLGDLESSQGCVIAASDDANMTNKSVDLEKYPEIREVLLNNSIIHIKDVTQNPLTQKIKDQVKSIEINSLLVFPIRHRGDTLGTLSIRLGKDGMEISDKHLKTFYIVALALAPKVAATKLMKKLQPPPVGKAP